MSRTYATLEVSPETYEDIRKRLEAVDMLGYYLTDFGRRVGLTLDGIALVVGRDDNPTIASKTVVSLPGARVTETVFELSDAMENALVVGREPEMYPGDTDLEPEPVCECCLGDLDESVTPCPQCRVTGLCRDCLEVHRCP
jgi:hypothetical protein